MVGVAGVDRLRTAPPGYRPREFLAGAKSVVVVASHFPKAIVDSWEFSPFSYLYYGYALINKELGRVAFYVAKALEREGFRSYPVVPTVYMQGFDYEGFVAKSRSVFKPRTTPSSPTKLRRRSVHQ